MSDQDPKDPTLGDAEESTSTAAPAESGMDVASGETDATDGFEDPFGDSNDPFGSADPFGLSNGPASGGESLDMAFEDAGSVPAPEDDPAATSGGIDEFEVMFEESAEPIQKDAIAPPSAPPAPPAPPAEEAGASDMTDNDLSAISSFRSRSRGVIFQSDDVFGGKGSSSTGTPKPPQETPSPGATFEPLGNDNPFGEASSAADTIRTNDLNLGRPAEEPPKADDFGDDPFASLGSPIQPEASATPPASNPGGSNFSSLLSDSNDEGGDDPFSQDFAGGGGGDDPFAGGDNDVFGGAFEETDGGGDPFAVGGDDDTFFVESAGVGGDGESAKVEGGEFNERVTSSFKIGKETKKPVVGISTKIGVGSLLVVTLVGGLMGLFTEWGYFGINLLFPPRHEVVVQAPVAQPAPEPVKEGEVSDTADAFIEEIKGKEKDLGAKPQDISLKEAVLSAHLNYRARFPTSYSINQKQFQYKVEQLKREVGLKAAPRLAALDLIHEGKFDEAKSALETALAAESSNAPIQFLYGRIAQQEGRLDEALEWYKKAVANDPSMLKALFYQGQIFETKRQFDEASTRYTEVLRNNPSHNTARLGLVRVRIATGDLAGAEQLANQALAEASAQKDREDQFLAHKVLALLNKQMNRNDHRLSHLKAAVGFKPTDTESVVELVDHYLHEEDSVNAEIALLTAANSGCAGPPFYDRLVRFFIQKDVAQAEIFATYALESHPDSALVYILRGEVAEKMGHAKNARSFYSTAIEVEPSLSAGYLALASIQQKSGRLSAAVKTLIEGEEKVSASTDILLALADMYRESAQVIKAKGIYEKILDQTPTNTRVRLSYAMLLTEIGYAEEAINQFKTLFSQGLTDNEATVGYATALTRAQRPREAIAQLNGLLRIQPQNVVANTQMGALNIELQSYKTAENYLRAALRVEPNHAPAYYHLGRLRDATGEQKEAIRELERAVELTPDDLGYRFELATAQSKDKDSRVHARRNLDQIITRYKDMEGAELATRNPNVYRLRGDIFFKSGDYKKALQDFEQAMLIDTSNLDAIAGLAVTLYKLNRVKEAEAYFQEILSKDRENSQAHYFLGRIAHSRGDARKSEDHLLAAVRRGEEAFADAHKTLGLMFRERKMSAPARRHLQLYLEQGDPTTEDRSEVERILRRIR